MVKMDVFEVEFHVWSIIFLYKNDSFTRRKLQRRREEANEQNPYAAGLAVVIVKRTPGCTENQGSWL